MRNEGGRSRLAPSVTRVVICVRAFCLTDQEKRESAGSPLSLSHWGFFFNPTRNKFFLVLLNLPLGRCKFSTLPVSFRHEIASWQFKLVLNLKAISARSFFGHSRAKTSPNCPKCCLKSRAHREFFPWNYISTNEVWTKQGVTFWGGRGGESWHCPLDYYRSISRIIIRFWETTNLPLP